MKKKPNSPTGLSPRKRANWKLMEPKDKAKFLAKNGVKTIELVSNIKLKECQQIYYSFVTAKAGKKKSNKTKEWRKTREDLKKARIPRHLWVRQSKPNNEKQRVVL